MRGPRWAVLFLSALSIVAAAQTVTPNIVTPSTATGILPFTTYNGVREDIALSNGNLNIKIPLLNLPQRAGGSWSLGIEYDSKTWEAITFPLVGGEGMAWNQDVRAPLVAPNLRVSVPFLQTTVNNVRTGEACLNSWILTTADGAKHTFNNRESCSGSNPDPPLHISDSGDASFIRLNTTNLSDVVATLKNGTQIHFYNLFVGTNNVVFGKIVDPNGNVISSTINSGVYTFTDSVGRIITIDTNNHNIGYKDANGSAKTITFTNANYSGGTPITFVHPQYGECWAGSVRIQTGSQTIGTGDSEWTMTIPDGASGLTYRFHYDSIGELTKITYPSGGYTKYDYAASIITWAPPGIQCTKMDFREVTAKHECRSATGSCGTEDTTTYTPTISGSSNGAMDVRAPDPSGTPNRTHSAFSSGGYPLYAPRETDRTVYSGESTVLRTFHTDYSTLSCSGICDISLPIRVTTTLNDASPNQVSKVETDYDTVTLTNPPGNTGNQVSSYIDNLVTVREFDFDGTVHRRNVVTWLNTGSYAIDQLHILDRELTSTVYDSTNNTCNGISAPCAQTTYEYDNYTEGLSSSGATQHQTMTTARGNLTAVSKWLNTNSTNLTTRFQYDDGGNVTKATDPKGNSTLYNLTDNFAQTSCTPAANGLTGNAAAYVKTVTNALSQVTTYSYNSCFGNLAVSSDANQQPTNYSYDTLGRTLSIGYPDGGMSTWTYNDVAPISITVTKKQSGTVNVVNAEFHDGLGRVSQTQLTSDPGGTDYVDTAYDVAGRIYSVSNAYRSVSDPTYGVTYHQYDALNRITTLTRQDGSTVLTTYAGSAQQVQDEGNGTSRVTRISQSDGLNRLTSVCEVSSTPLLGSGATPAACGLNIAATGFLTSYQYDALNNLISVAQNGLNGRTFVYDSLSRMTSTTNPESGTTTYAYDSNGNLITRTDVRGITTNYSPMASPIDALNRVTQKTYTDGTPTVTFTYDVSTADGLTGLQNTVGRLVETSVGNARNVNSYDPMGRIQTQRQCTPQNCGSSWFTLSYQYDFLGNQLSLGVGSWYTLTYAYNAATQLTGITSSWSDANHPGTLFSSGLYSAVGSLTSGTLGNGIALSRSYNPRTYLSSLSDGTAYSLALTYAPNGDLLTGNDSVNGNWTYGYDDFNRLKSASATGQAYTFDYDRFGNRWHQNGPYTVLESFSSNNNRMDGFSYDSAGNLLNDGTHNYSYDGENRVKQVDGGSTATYTYDALGNRVRKSTSTNVDYLYDSVGHAIAEVSSAGGLNRGEIYGGDRHIGTYGSNATYFIHADHLGTERRRTDVSGGSIETCTSLAFGDHLSCSGSDVSPLHFIGKERDSESGLDNFGKRYYGSSMGRFMTTDPVVITTERLLNPQQLNLYAYVANNPLRFIDPTGEILQCVGDDKSRSQCFSDLQQIAGDAANRLSMDAKTGVVSFDTKDLDLSKNAGAALVNDLVGSKNTFDFSVGPTIMTDKGPVRIDKISTNMANLPTFGDQPQIGNPPAGVSDILGLNLNNPNMTRVSNTNLKVSPEWTVAFHELAEAYEKIDGGKGGSYAAGHNAALQRELELRDQRPYLKEYNTGAGGPANSPNPQGGIIIKK